jgi:glutamate N-acetyltransferase/amino-acid N-acetyltransferase
MTVSPLAPDSFPTLPSVAGVRLATHAAGMKYQKRADLMLAAVAEGTTIAGTLTQSQCPSAPVDWCRHRLVHGTARALVCNAGNANAFTGRAGETATQLTADTVALALNIDADEVFLASTGVIGESLAHDTLAASLPLLADGLTDSGPEAWNAAAQAILTTDTFAKGAYAPVLGTDAVVVGIAKGSGMIAPDMATMLAFVFTDVNVDAALFQECTSDSVEQSFNRITVDSDTSTSDTVLAFATGATGVAIDSGGADEAAFRSALDEVMLSLAQQIVRDGEGATKFVEVTVHGAADDVAAKIIALSIANSPLVKTALAAEDANWGRIVMAVGKAGQAADRDKLRIWIGDELVAENGVLADGYNEARATDHLRQDEVRVSVDVGVADGVATIWTCDLTHGYIEINAGYRS